MTAGFNQNQISNLLKSKITIETAIRAGIRPIYNYQEAVDLLGFNPHPDAVPALAIPIFKNGDSSLGPEGWRIRPDNEIFDKDGKRIKYLQPKSFSSQIYIPPLDVRHMINDGKNPLFITEGEKKAICASVHGIPTIAGFGVWNFHQPKSSDDPSVHFQLLESLRNLAIPGRLIYICFDAGKLKNQSVLHAEIVLAKMLTDHGATVKLLHLPMIPGNSDTGLDDYIVVRGVDELKKLQATAWAYPIDDFIDDFDEPETVKEKQIACERFVGYLALEPQDRIGPLVASIYKKVGYNKSAVINMIIERRRKYHEQKHLQEGSLKDHLEVIRVEGKKHAECSTKRWELVTAERIAADMQSKGKFIRDGELLWYYNAETHEVNSFEHGKSLRLHLISAYGVVASTHEYPFVLNYLDQVATRDGINAAVHKFSHYDAQNDQLYVANGPSRMFHITRFGYKDVPNGTEGVYFSSDLQTEPIAPRTSFDRDAFKRKVSEYNYLANGLDKEYITEFLRGYLLFCIFSKEMLPILNLKGDHGSGKSKLARVIGQMLFGVSFANSTDFSGIEDVKAAICAKLMLSWDNVETLDNSYINVLCTCVTGGNIEKRKLYTNNEMVSFRPRCAVILTSRSDDFMQKRPDLSTRTIPLELEPFKANVANVNNDDEICELRTHFWSHFLDEAPEILRRLARTKDRKMSFESRLADFFGFGARAFGDEDCWRDLERKIVLRQASASLNESLWFKAMKRLVEVPAMLDPVEFPLEELPARYFWEKLDNIAINDLGCPNGLGFEPPRLGRIFNEQQRFINQYFDFKVHQDAGGDRSLYSLKPKTTVLNEQKVPLPETATYDWWKGALWSEVESRANKVYNNDYNRLYLIIGALGAELRENIYKNKKNDSNEYFFNMAINKDVFPSTAPAPSRETDMPANADVDFSRIPLRPRKAINLLKEKIFDDESV